MDGTCSTYGEQERCIEGFMEKFVGKRPLGRSRHRWEDNIKIYIEEVGWGHGLD
jgi:hypothetical protein